MSGLGKGSILGGHLKVRGAARIRQAVAGHHPRIESIAARIAHLARQPLTVAVMGEFNAGKSSFLNRLLGQAVLPVGILPKTATLTRLVYGEEGRVEIDWQRGEGIVTQEASYEEFAELQHAARIQDPGELEALEPIQEVRVFLQDPLLQRLHLLDTPGFNHDQAMDQKTLGVLDAVDVVIWISDYTAVAKRSELDQLGRLRDRGKRIWLVVNKGDVHVSDSVGHAEAVKTLGDYLKSSGFLDLFQNEEVSLISCKTQDGFWDAKFEQLKARLAERILNADLELSVALIGDEWRRLGDALRDEAERYQALRSRYETLAGLTDPARLVEANLDGLAKALEPQVTNLLSAIETHGSGARPSTGNRIPSLTTFVMEYTRGNLDQSLRSLAEAFEHELAAIRRRHLIDVTPQLDAVLGLIPAEREELRGEVETLLAYHRLRLDVAAESGGAVSEPGLPAVERTVEMLDHLGVQFQSIDWCFTAQVVELGVLEISQVGEPLKLDSYRRLQVETALLRDWEADAVRVCGDPALVRLVKRLGDLSRGTDQRLKTAETLWSDTDG